MAEIKKIIKRLYEFDLSNCEFEDGNEIITENGISEFVTNFGKRDLDNGIMVTPSGYSKGLVYKSTNGGEFYNNPSWVPDIVSFAYDVYGLKKGAFYKVSVVGRNAGRYNSIIDITDNRKIQVSNEQQELLISADLTDIYDNIISYGIFRANSNETNLFFSIGKVYISNIIIEEVEIVGDNSEITEETTETTLEIGKTKVVAYGIYTTIPNIDKPELYAGRYLPMTRITGSGINLYYDKIDKKYCIERDNIEETLNSSFINVDCFVDININKLVNTGEFSGYRITDVSNEISQNTLKQGYIKFQFIQGTTAVDYYNKEGRIAIIITKLL